jgi:hypothetical protein
MKDGDVHDQAVAGMSLLYCCTVMYCCRFHCCTAVLLCCCRYKELAGQHQEVLKHLQHQIDFVTGVTDH